MCGIFFSCSREDQHLPAERFCDSLCKRGPDSVNKVYRSILTDDTTSQQSSPTGRQQAYHLTFLSTVLSLRGDSIVRQPLGDHQSGSLLCWNGEAWKLDNDVVQGNDAESVFGLFQTMDKSHFSSTDDHGFTEDPSVGEFIKIIRSITGPYAFVFYDAQHQRVWYGRDALGRRSLNIKNELPERLSIASICDPTDLARWTEVEADGIHMIDLRNPANSSNAPFHGITHFPWRVNHGQSSSYNLVQSPYMSLDPLRH